MGSDAGAVKNEEPGRAGLWEDFVDIFYAPSSVFARRADGKFGMALLLLVVVGTVLVFVTKNATQPIMDAEFARQSAAMLRKNFFDRIEGLLWLGLLVRRTYKHLGDLHRGIDGAVFSLDELVDWADRDERDGEQVPDDR